VGEGVHRQRIEPLKLSRLTFKTIRQTLFRGALLQRCSYSTRSLRSAQPDDRGWHDGDFKRQCRRQQLADQETETFLGKNANAGVCQPPRCGVVVFLVTQDGALNEAFARLPRSPDHVTTRTGSNVDGIRKESCRGRDRLAVTGVDLKAAL
jgi:hypothetical protein